MTTNAGTLEQILLLTGRALGPLEIELAPSQVRTLLAELGLEFPPELINNANFINALDAGRGAAANLAPIIEQLQKDIEDGDTVGIIQESAELVNAIRTVIDSLDRAGDELNNLAGALPGLDPVDVSEFASKLASNLFEYLLVTYMEGYQPILLTALSFLGLVEMIPEPGNEADPSKPPFIRRHFHLDRLGLLLSSPKDLFRTIYGWGDPTFKGDTLIQALHQLIFDLGLPSIYEPTGGPGSSPLLRLFWVRFYPRTDITPRGLELVLEASFNEGTSISIPFLYPGWTFKFTTEGRLDAGLSARAQPPLSISLDAPSGSAQGRVILGIVVKPSNTSLPFILLGQADGSRIQASEISLEGGVSLDAKNKSDSFAEFRFKDASMVIKPGSGDADSFLSSLLPRDGFSIDFNLIMGLSASRGFYFAGSSGLKINIPAHKSIGPIEIDGIALAIGFSGGAIPIDIGSTLKGKIGPVQVLVENFGLRVSFSFPSDLSGNLGPVNLDLGFKPPDGIGITIDAGPITGGGFIRFDPANARYSGALQLKIYEISVSAIGILDTRLPGGAQGYSFIILISGEFAPIQLGLGFTLSGVGGLAGIHRTVVVEALQSGIKSHLLDRILFPKDPIGNAPRIISDLGTVFPPASNKYVFGPMAIIGWGTPNILQARLGIILELPDPVRLLILGQISAVLPSEDLPLIELHIDVVGVIDFTNKHLAIDSTLHDSRIISFSISGDMALRLDWGENPNFALAIGGFHPDFKPPPGFPALQRVTLSVGWWPTELQLQAYFAITSNTLQFGAQVDLYIQAGIFNIKGTLGIDALFIFSPFSFVAGLHGGIALRFGRWNLIGVSLSGQLSGPAPWHATGEACISILFWDICADFDLTWGEEEREELPQIDPWPLLQKAIKDGRNWSAQPAAMALRVVSLAPPAAGAPDIIVDPVGNLSFHQKVLPLNRRITKFGETKPLGPDRYNLDRVRIGSEGMESKVDPEMLQDFFAPAHFEEMSDAERLSRESFAKMDSGIAIHSSSVDAGDRFTWTRIDYETHKLTDEGIIRDKDKYTLKLNVQQSMILKGAAVRSSLRNTGLEKFSNMERSRVQFRDEEYVVVSSDTLLAVNVSARPGPMNKDAAYQAMYDYLRDHPLEKDRLQVVPKAEVPDGPQKVYA